MRRDPDGRRQHDVALVRFQLVEAAGLAAERFEPFFPLLDDLVQVLVGPHGVAGERHADGLHQADELRQRQPLPQRLFERAVLRQMPDEVFVVPELFELVRLFAHQLIDWQRPLLVPRRGFLEQGGHLGQFFVRQIVDDLQERFEIGIGHFVADLARLEELLRLSPAAGRQPARTSSRSQG